MEALLARAVQLLVALGGAYLLALWFALVVWTFQDIQRRSRSVIAQIFSTLVVVLFFIPGVLIYLILRPQDTLDETFQRSLEEEYLLQDLEELALCPSCQRYVQDDFAFCPFCRVELRQPCVSCERLVDLRWQICPYCGADQYGDAEEEVEELPDWTRREPASVSRIMQQARERIAGRWTRLPEPDGGPAGRTAAMYPDAEGQTVSWNGDSTDSWTFPTRAAQADGNEDASTHDAWDPQIHGESSDALDRTDEIPTGSSRPKP